MPANVFVFLPQHKSSLADLLNSTYGSVRKKKIGWNKAVLGKRQCSDHHHLRRKCSVNAAKNGQNHTKILSTHWIKSGKFAIPTCPLVLDRDRDATSAKPVTTRQTPRLRADPRLSTSQGSPQGAGSWAKNWIPTTGNTAYAEPWALRTASATIQPRACCSSTLTSLDRTRHPTVFLVYLKRTFLECS